MSNPAEPAIADDGLMLVIDGGDRIVNVCGEDAVMPFPVTAPTVAEPTVASSEDATVAVSWVEETSVVGSDAPFHVTVSSLVRFTPVTVIVKPALPARILLGLIDCSVGRTVIVNVRLDVAGAVALVTATVAVPAVAISVDGTCAVTVVAETNVVVSADPFHVTTESAAKFDPVTVRVNAGPVAIAVLGDRLPIAGAGLIVNVSGLDALPLPSTTVTVAVPGAAINADETCAVISVAEMNVVVIAAPFHCTLHWPLKPVPTTVIVKPAAVA